MKPTKPKPTSNTKKAGRPRGRPALDLSEISGSIPMEPEKFAKILLNMPPQTLKKR